MEQKKSPMLKWAIGLVLVIAIGTGGYFGWRAWTGSEIVTTTDKPFKIGMVTFAGYAPFYLAKEKELFDGLPVELHRIEEIASIRAGMANGTLDAYLATPDIALDINERPPGIAVWAIDESSGGDGVVVADGINSLKDLKGKKIAAEPGLPPNFVLLYLLHKNGLSLSDVKFQDMTTQNAATAFVAKSVDAAGLYEPYLSTSKGQREGSKVVLSSADTPGMIVDLIFVRKEALDKRPGDVKKVIAGWRKAVKLIEQSPDSSNEIMAKAFNLPVADFKDIAGGVKWLDVADNQKLFGSQEKPGPLYANFDLVGDVLRGHRPAVYKAKADDHLSRVFVNSLK